MDRLSLSLGSAPDPAAAATVRRAATARFGHLLSASVLGDLMLLTTELVTNAIRHGSGHVEVRFAITARDMKVEVIDEGPGFEHEVREFGSEAMTGRGLTIVSRVAQRWGVYEGSSHVWFVLARRQAPLSDSEPWLGEPPPRDLPDV